MIEWIKALSRVLYVDLVRKRYWVDDRADLFERWMGGIGVATHLYKEEVPRGADPLGPDNVVIFAQFVLCLAYILWLQRQLQLSNPLSMVTSPNRMLEGDLHLR